VTSFSTVIGAIPGALPPVIGWAAAREELSQGAWVLFGIVFLWQLPHFLSIAWMYREDYARGGFPMLPLEEATGASTGRQVVLQTLALLVVSLLPTLIRLTGRRHSSAPSRSHHLRDLAVKFAWPQPRRRAPAVLRVDHLSAAAVDPDDRRSSVETTEAEEDQQEERRRKPFFQILKFSKI
jgi:heme O synthase-like polyprenyltransferase